MFGFLLRVALLLSVGVAPAMAANTWYVTTSGNDTNDGKSLGTAFLTLAHAAGVTAPGDTVNCIGNFGGGTGGSDPLTINIPGTAGNVISYQSYYQGLAGPACVVMGTQSFNAIHITPSATANIAYITVNNLEVAGPNGSITLAAAWTNASASTFGSTGLYNGGGIVIDNGTNPTNQTSSGTSSSGQPVITLSTNPTTGGVLPGDSVYDTTTPTNTPTGSAIVLSRTTTSITLTTNLTASIATGHTLKVVHVPHHINVTNNRIHDFPENGIQCAEGDYMTISGNIIYNNALYSPFAGSGISCGFSRDIDTTTGYKMNVLGNLAGGNINIIANHFNSLAGTTNATTAVGNATLHFAAAPLVLAGWQVYNTTSGNSGSILAGTTVVSRTSTTIVMSNNAQTGSGSGVGSGNTFLFAQITDGKGIIIDDNQGDQLGEPAYGGATLVQNNVTVGNGSSGIYNFDSNNVDIVFNTTYLNQTNENSGGEIGNLGAINGHIENNVIQTGASNPLLINQSTSGTVFAFNLAFGGNGTTVTGTNNITGQDPLFVAPTATLPTGTLTLNPLTWTAFQLQPGSPAIDVATGAFTRTTDFLGNPGLAGPSYDMGAYETPCSPYGANPIQSMTSLMGTQFADGQSAYAFTLSTLRKGMTSVWCGRSPYSR